MTSRRSFRLVLAGQFLGSLADSALLLVAIAFLIERHSGDWATPALRIVFYLAYVALAALAGALADAVPKRRVLLATNLVKLAGCAALLLHMHPVVAYGLVGVGAAAHAPAKYGILSELLGAAEMVAANAWLEAATVVAMLLGVLLGSLLVAPGHALQLVAGSVASNATIVLASIYLAAALCAAGVRAGAAANPEALARPAALVRDFAYCARRLWRDADARTSLAVTSLFWAAAATLQLLLLRWAAEALQLTLSQASLLQGAVAVGMVAGAAAAGRWIPARRVLQVLPLGAAMGVAVMLVPLVTQVWLAAVLLLGIGVTGGLLLVPMNTLLQQRGLALMHPGQSISVQHFNENLASLLLLAAYGALTLVDTPSGPVIAALGALLLVAMLLVQMQRRGRAGSLRWVE